MSLAACLPRLLSGRTMIFIIHPSTTDPEEGGREKVPRLRNERSAFGGMVSC